jgi:hypothetical protein
MWLRLLHFFGFTNLSDKQVQSYIQMKSHMRAETTTKTLLQEYRTLSRTQKIGLWGSVASIVGVLVVFLPVIETSTPDSIQVTSGNTSPNINVGQGNITIKYNGNSHGKEPLSSEEKGFPTTTGEKKTVKEVLSYLQIQLTLLNGIYELFFKALDRADEYNRYSVTSGYQTLVKSIKFSQKEMQDLLAHNHPLSPPLRGKLSDTPLSEADLAVLYDYVNHDVRELSERLAFLLVLFDPDMAFSRSMKDKWVSLVREGQSQGVLSLSYAVCEFLFPINSSELRDFRKEFLPGLTTFESDAFDFSLDETQLQQLQISAQRKRDAIGTNMASIVGEMNVKSEVFEARLQELRKEFQRIRDRDGS